MINKKEVSKTKVKKDILICILFIFLITMFYTIRLLETRLTTKYAFTENSVNLTDEEIRNNTLSVKDFLINSNNNVYSYKFNLIVISILIFSIMAFRRIKEDKKNYLFCIILGILCCIMATNLFPWKWLKSFFCFIKYPWRMVEFATFLFTIICGININVLIPNLKMRDFAILSIICICLTIPSLCNYPKKDNLLEAQAYSLSNVSGKNGETLVGMGKLEYLPVKAYSDTYYTATRQNSTIVLDGKCDISDEVKMGTYTTFKLKTYDNEVLVEFPYIYYPGYTVKFDGVTQKSIETENGYVGCYFDSNESGKVEIKYTGTNLMNISRYISIISCIIYLIYEKNKTHI